MDGNGRWAQRRGVPRLLGHRAGRESVREAVRGRVELGVEVLTLYTFSLENWERPRTRGAGRSCASCSARCARRSRTSTRSNVRLARRSAARGTCSPDVRDVVDHAIDAPGEERRACTLVLALSYSGRAEIVDAVRRARGRGRRAAGRRRSRSTRSSSSAPLHGRPARSRSADPHERRVRLSNFLLWQLAYTELVGRRRAVARLPAQAPLPGGRRLPGPRAPLRAGSTETRRVRARRRAGAAALAAGALAARRVVCSSRS